MKKFTRKLIAGAFAGALLFPLATTEAADTAACQADKSIASTAAIPQTGGYRISIDRARYIVKDDDGTVGNADYSLLELTDKDGEHASLKSAIEKLNEDIGKRARKDFADLKEAMAEDKKIALSANRPRARMNTEYVFDLVRADKKYLSLTGYLYGYLGGAHPYHAEKTFNYDAKTGKLVTLPKICNDLPALFKVMKDKLYKEYPDRSRTFFDLDKFFAEQLKEKGKGLNFLIKDNHVLFIFNQYDIAPYAAGQFSLEITKADCPALNF